MTKRLIYIAFILILCSPMWAVETLIVGDVIDAETGLPIQNVSVYYQYSKIGTTTNQEGFFSLHTNQEKTFTLIFSAIGYKTHRLSVAPGSMQGVQIRLIPRTAQLDDVVVLPGANPAIPLIEQVRQHKQVNDLSLSEDYHAEWLTEEGLYVSDLQSKHLRRRLWKNLRQGMVQLTDSSYLLPIGLIEGSMVLESRHLSTQVLSTRSLMPTEIEWTSLVDRMPRHCNFYQSTIPLFKQSILSPLAASANSFYSYYLIDSVVTNYYKHYLIDFRPKNPHYPLFTGRMEVDSATHALCRVFASTPREVNIDLLRELHIDLRYDNQHNLVYEHQQAVLDMAIQTDSSHIFPSLLIERRLHVQSDQQTAAEQSAEVIPNYTRAAIIDSALLQTPLLRVAHWIGTTLATGYMPTGSCIDIGNIVELLQFNPIEIVHAGLPLRTNQKLWPHVSIEAYAAYGWGDQAWKGKGQLMINLPTERRHLIGMRYWDHYQHTEANSWTTYTRENLIGYGDQRWMATMFRSPWDKNPNHWSGLRRKSLMLWSENDWWQGSDRNGHELRIESQCAVEIGKQYTRGNGWGYTCDDPYFHFSLVRGYLRLGWDERISDHYMQRHHFYHHMPTLFLGGELGSYQLPTDSYYNIYGRIDIGLRQDISLGIGGRLSYNLQAGILFGDVPYPMLHIFSGRAGVLYHEDRFGLLSSGEAAADQYIALHLNWDGQGVLFNLIPGIRRLGLHELIETKMAYGTLREGHKHVIALPTTMHTLQDCPYIEMGVGIGHLLRFFDLYSIWRITRRDDPDASLWTMQFRLSL